MSFALNTFGLALVLFVGMLLAQDLGRRLGLQHRERVGADFTAGTGVVDGAVFALLGLLIAFTFSGAAGRFDARRQYIVVEANAIGTAYLRLDLLPTDARAHLRELFGQYLDARLAVYRSLPDISAAQADLALANQLQRQIWEGALSAASGSQPATMLLLPALNDMFDITTTRTRAALTHPPVAIFGLLCFFSVLSGVLAGYSTASSKERNWMHMSLFAVTLAASLYVILDLEYPRFGLIRIDQADQVLIDLRASMK